MAVSSGTSSLLSVCLFILLFAIMQVYKAHIASTQLATIVGGYLGSILFILALTAIGNLETSLIGKNAQTKLFPEVVLSLVIAMTASGLVHRVCITTCFIFSLVALYYMNKLSMKTYNQPVVNVPVGGGHAKSKRK